MPKALIIFEDGNYSNFFPLTLLRPIYFLRPGIRALFEKIIDGFIDYDPHLFCRPEISEITGEMTKCPVNHIGDSPFDEFIFVNGRIKYNRDFLSSLKSTGKNAILVSHGNILAFKIMGKLNDRQKELLNEGDLGGFLDKLKSDAETLEVELPMYDFLWDFVNNIDEEIIDDFEHFRKHSDSYGSLKNREEMKEKERVYPGVEFIGIENIYVAPDVELMPGVVIDASKGPIFIGSSVRVEPFSYLEGPLYIGKKTVVAGGKINRCSIGPVCRIWGELEATIVQGYSNKHHAGFIGHSYLGEWINLGAMTTNSDLKNNYSNVKVSVNGEPVDTGSLKVGSFIGDFTKTAIGTLLNTGINIGVVCNIVSEGLITEREIASFTWYSSRHKVPYNLVRAIETIEISMSRRNEKLSIAFKKRLSEISHGAVGPQASIGIADSA